MGTMTKDVHQQFGLLAVGHTQFEAAVVKVPALLVGVPFFMGAAGCGVKAKQRLIQLNSFMPRPSTRIVVHWRSLPPLL